MRVFDQGAFYRVAYNKEDADHFSRRWPCSTVKGHGSFTFDKRNGDLVDNSGTAATHDGEDWLAFSQDCQKYGEKTLAGRTTMHHRSVRLFNNAGMEFPLCFAGADKLDTDKGRLATTPDESKVTCKNCKRVLAAMRKAAH